MKTSTIQVIADVDFIERLKLATKEKTASGAYKYAAQQFQVNEHYILTLRDDVQNLKEQVSKLKTKCYLLDSACREILEITGQEELL